MLRLLLGAALTLGLAAAPVIEKYASVSVGDDGKVTVVTQDGKRITPKPEKDQVGAERAAVAPDHQSVGWLALSALDGNMSDLLPFKLIVLNSGRTRTYAGDLPIFFWAFLEDGKTVAFKMETPHSSRELHYAHYDVTSGRRLGEYTPDYDWNGQAIRKPKEPQWVRQLDAAEQKQR